MGDGDAIYVGRAPLKNGDGYWRLRRSGLYIRGEGGKPNIFGKEFKPDGSGRPPIKF